MKNSNWKKTNNSFEDNKTISDFDTQLNGISLKWEEKNVRFLFITFKVYIL